MTVELVREPRNWWQNTEELAEFAEWMVDTGREVSWKAVVAKPWHFAAERREYERELEMERLAEEERAYEREARWAP